MTTDTGGSAFPRLGLKVMEPNGTIVPHEPGLTMRDYFAAKAMQALLSADRYMGLIGVNNFEHRRAEDAYKVADAMLKARQE